MDGWYVWMYLLLVDVGCLMDLWLVEWMEGLLDGWGWMDWWVDGQVGG